jgi:Outer membrane protein beta-barrel domain
MKTLRISLAFVLLLLLTIYSVRAQEIQTLFKHSRASGGYGALSNKFTHINGQYANLAEIYGGWFINKKFMIGVGAAASTNNLEVPLEHSTDPTQRMSWQYGQFGLATEYVFWSNRIVHVNVGLFSGAGFTVQYERKMDDWDDWDDDNFDDVDHDENFFFVMEPGVQVEVNVLRWMRFSPGVSYRKAFGSDGIGLKDNDLSDWSYNVTLKFGKF